MWGAPDGEAVEGGAASEEAGGGSGDGGHRSRRYSGGSDVVSPRVAERSLLLSVGDHTSSNEDVPRNHAIRKTRCHWPELFLRAQLDALALCAPKDARLSIGCDDIMKQCREVPTARVPLDYSRDTTARLAPETHRRALGTRMIFHPHPLPLFSPLFPHFKVA